MEDVTALKWAFVDLVYDLTCPSVVFRETAVGTGRPLEVAVVRMCVSHAIVALCKFDELTSRYGKLLRGFPSQLHAEAMAAKQQIERREMYAFRSTYVAHALDSKTHRPMTRADGEAAMDRVTGGSHSAFFDWVCPVAPGRGVSHLVSELKDHCRTLEATPGQRP